MCKQKYCHIQTLNSAASACVLLHIYIFRKSHRMAFSQLHSSRAAQWLLAAALACSMASASAQERPDYPLGAGDSLRIQVYQNPDLNIETRLSESGSITYPLIGAVDLNGLSTAAAEKKIADLLQKGGFLQKPQVNIALTQVRGNQVSILGQVQRPGRYPLESVNTRLSDMLANAGGIAPGGDDMVIVVGQRDGKPMRRVVDMPSLFLGEGRSSDLLLLGGDIVYVHRAPLFYIYGEAQRPGSYRIERGMTFMQALAQGGGPNARGNEKRLRLNRKAADGSIQQLEPLLTDMVLPDDVIYVKESLF
jgi:polysaccharide export outer membrane protein